MKITFGIIALNADFFLKQVLESIYPYAHKICIAEGPVQYWINKGVLCSTDDTSEIIHTFPDPYNKIKVIHSTYKEKTEQCKAWFSMVPEDTDYVFCVDADEIHSPENLDKFVDYLKKEQPTSVGFKSDTFYGGFERIIGGFERDHSFKRVLKYIPGCIYRTHRQPTLALSSPILKHDMEYVLMNNVTDIEGQGYYDISGKDITGNQLYEATGITMWHGSYVSPRGVYEKIQYYEDSVIKKGNCIPNYFKDVWLKWVQGDDYVKYAIEQEWKGVQEFIPRARGEAFTEPFIGNHPKVIRKYLPELKYKFIQQLDEYAAK